MGENQSNIVLIGMPGVGKSTVGVLLAKAAGRSFLDTDVLIQAGEDRCLQEILDTCGTEEFCRIEERYLLCLEVRRHVVATGGSAVYSPTAMESLRRGGVIVHLELPLEHLARRITNMATRGIVMAGGQSIAELYAQRQPLYRRWADLTVPCEGLTQDQAAARIVDLLAEYSGRREGANNGE